jgi:hypothetical protein
MADGTLKVGTITTSSGSGDITIPSGNGMTGHNYPAFAVYMSANQSAANNTYTKINFDTEDYDTHNAYDTSNNRFTVPSDKAGKYIFCLKGMVDQVDDTERVEVVFYKNGSIDNKSLMQDYAPTGGSATFANTSFVYDLVVGDYIEAYLKHTEGGARDIESGYSYFFGYRIGA